MRLGSLASVFLDVILGFNLVAVRVNPGILTIHFVLVNHLRCDLGNAYDIGPFLFQESLEMVNDDSVSIGGSWVVIGPRVINELAKELVDGNVLLGESEFIPGDLYFSVL